MCDKIKAALLIALAMLPLAATLIHIGVPYHNITWEHWVTYLTLFDVIVVTALFVYEKTKIYGFWINTLLGLAGIVYHAQTSMVGTISDSMIIVADIMIGFALLTYVAKTKKLTKRKVTRRKK